jgi:hypothetical protein
VLQKSLEAQLSALRAWIASHSEAHTGPNAPHRSADGRPLSIDSRVKGARSALLSECEKSARLRAANLQGNVELYWVSKAMEASVQAMWAALDLEEVRRREEICGHVAERFASLVPPSMFQSFEQACQSPGALAVAVTEAQGRNTDFARRLRELDERLVDDEEESSRIDIGEVNIEAAGTLAEFEWSVLAGGMPFPGFPKGEFASGMRGVTEIHELRIRCEEIAQVGAALEAQVAQVKATLAQSIDLLERVGASPQSKRLLAECKKACVRSLES